MSKIVAILMSTLLCFQSFGISVDDMMAIDELLEHASYHKAKYDDSFFTFLSKHYGQQSSEHQQTHHEEHDDHEQLPFQQQSQIISNVVLMMDAQTVIVLTNFMNFNQARHSFFYTQDPYASLFKSGVFQPPRHA